MWNQRAAEFGQRQGQALLVAFALVGHRLQEAGHQFLEEAPHELAVRDAHVTLHCAQGQTFFVADSACILLLALSMALAVRVEHLRQNASRERLQATAVGLLDGLRELGRRLPDAVAGLRECGPDIIPQLGLVVQDTHQLLRHLPTLCHERRTQVQGFVEEAGQQAPDLLEQRQVLLAHDSLAGLLSLCRPRLESSRHGQELRCEVRQEGIAATGLQNQEHPRA
mmetsp:Transcript_31431/g.90757  ORF Transcript_31431/g.90757 Transcript_31431/m.90757 type:complete len:224 (-) Transcript_31431:1504-2175(-)